MKTQTHAAVAVLTLALFSCVLRDCEWEQLTLNAINNVIKGNCRSMLTTVYILITH